MRPLLAPKKIAALAVSLLLAALAAVVYHSFFLSPFVPVRMTVVFGNS